MTKAPPRDNAAGGIWLLADMGLNLTALSLVKWMGVAYPAAQIVFVRALVGLLLIAPLIWRRRAMFRGLDNAPLHAARVALSVVTLTASFYAIARVPLALFTAIGFTRPIVTMILVAVMLREPIGGLRWIAAVVAFLGVLIAVNPGQVQMSAGLAALGLVVLTGSGAVVLTRRLRDVPATVMMAVYTGGLVICTAPFALYEWVPIAPEHRLPIVLVGAFAQVAQLCFLYAHRKGEAGYLSVLSYLSLVLSFLVGVVVFDEIPTVRFVLGAVLVVGAAIWVTRVANMPKTRW